MTRRLRPLITIPRYWPHMGGAELHTRRLAQELAIDHDPRVVHVCSTESTPTDWAYSRVKNHHFRDASIEVHQIGADALRRPVLNTLGSFAPHSRLARGLYARIAQPGIDRQIRNLSRTSDIVHAIYNGFTPLARAAARSGKPFVWTPLAHTSLPEGKGWSSAGFRALYRRADALIAMTEYEKDWLTQQGACADKVYVCPMAPLFDEGTPDPVAFRAQWHLGDDPVILFLGRLVDSKGYNQLIAARQEIWARHPTARIVMIGPVAPDIKQGIDALGDARLVVTGTISGVDKKSALAACDLLCVPSREESLGVIYLEAWSFGKPVVAFDMPVMRSVIEDGKDGLLCTDDPADLADKVCALLSSPKRARSMGCQGQAKVDRTYNWAETARRLTSVYNTLA